MSQVETSYKSNPIVGIANFFNLNNLHYYHNPELRRIEITRSDSTDYAMHESRRKTKCKNFKYKISSRVLKRSSKKELHCIKWEKKDRGTWWNKCHVHKGKLDRRPGTTIPLWLSSSQTPSLPWSVNSQTWEKKEGKGVSIKIYSVSNLSVGSLLHKFKREPPTILWTLKSQCSLFADWGRRT